MPIRSSDSGHDAPPRLRASLGHVSAAWTRFAVFACNDRWLWPTPRAGNKSTRLVLIRGNSGSGKSVLAAAIRRARPRGVAIIGHDQLRRDILNVPDRPGALSVPLIDLTARLALQHGLHVVIEGILHEEIYGDMLRRLVAEHRGVSRCYRYELTFAETLRRHATKGCVAQEVGEAQLRSWWRDHDPLLDVAERVIGAEFSLQDSVQVVLKDCGWSDLSGTAPSAER